MTITSHNSIQSFEIAPGPITTSVRKEASEYDAHPFTYSREALSGKLEVWDCPGRLVYSWQRAYSSKGVQQQPSLISTQSPTQDVDSGSSLKLERSRVKSFADF